MFKKVLTSQGFFSYLYLSLIAAIVISSMLYGNLLEGNIGGYPSYTFLSELIDYPFIILVPIAITSAFIVSLLIAYKNNIFKFNRSHLIFIGTLFLILLYMIFVISFKDYEHAFIDQNIVSIADTKYKAYSILSFYLSLLTIYIVIKLVKPIKGYKSFFAIILGIILVYGFSAIIYSLINESTKYQDFKFLDYLTEKNYANLINSFFNVGNSFGHLMYFCVLASFLFSFLYRKYYFILLALFFTPFVVFSGCRAAMISTFFAYIFYIIYTYIRSYHYSKFAFEVYSLALLMIILAILFDATLKPLFIFETNGGENYTLVNLIAKLTNTFLSDRYLLLINMSKNNLPIDYIFGFGYGLAYLVARSYGGVYYYHNSFYEILMTGGIPYFIFISGIYLYVAYYIFKKGLKTKRYNIIAIFIMISFSECFYGLCESMPILFNNYFGVINSLFIVVLPKLFLEGIVEGDKYSITSVNIFSLRTSSTVKTISSN